MPSLQLNVRLRAIARILAQPEYALRALLYAVLIVFILQWLFAYDQLIYVFKNFGVVEVVRYLIEGSINFYTYVFYGFIPLAILTVAIILGVVLSLRHFVAKGHFSSKKQSASAGVALIGAGCIACGGSILTPLLSSLNAGVASFYPELLSAAFLFLAVVLAVISLYEIAGIASKFIGD